MRQDQCNMIHPYHKDLNHSEVITWKQLFFQDKELDELKIFADKPKEEMFFRMTEIAISIYPQTGATILPLLSFGLPFAKNILFTADKFGLEELKNLNFPTMIFSPDKSDIETKKLIRTFSKRMDSFMFLMKSSYLNE